MRLKFFLLILTLTASVSISQNAPTLQWLKDIYHESPRRGNIPFKISMVDEDIIYVSNYDGAYGAEHGFFVHKYDKTGIKMWEYSNPGTFPEYQNVGLAATFDDQGNTYISTAWNYIKKIDSTGDTLWTKNASFNYNGLFYPERPKYLSYRNGKIEGSGYHLVQYDNHGNFTNLLYNEQSMRDPSYDDFGNTYFIGDSVPIVDHERRIVKLDKDHNKVWKVVLGYNTSSGIDVDPKGNIFLLSTDKIGSKLSKYDTGGHLMWKTDLTINVYCPFTSIVAESICADREGNVFVAGDVSDSSGLKLAVCKFSSAGKLIWKYDWNEPDKDFTRIHPTGIIKKGNDLYIAGYKRNQEGFYPHGFLMKLNDVDNLNAVNEEEIESAFWQVYPNPSSEFITVKSKQQVSNGETVNFELFTATGVVITIPTLRTDPQTWVINVANLSEGCYFLSIKIGNNLAVKKIFTVK